GGRHCSRRLLRVQRGLPPQPSANTICILSFLPRIHAFPGLSEMTEAARSLDFDRIREDMVERQIRTWEVFDQAVLDLMKVVPRENFVPDSMRALACADMNVPIGEGEVMLAPKVEGRMLQALAITRGDSDNVTLETRDASTLDGFEQQYEVIVVTGSMPVLHDSFRQRLKPNGRLLAIVGQDQVMEAQLHTRTGENDWAIASLFDTVVPPLVNAWNPQRFPF